MGTKVPSMTEPFRLKYHSIAFRLAPSQFNAGVTPVADLRAEVSVESEYVLLLSGVMPAFDKKSYVGRVCSPVSLLYISVRRVQTDLEELHDSIEECNRFGTLRAAGR